LSGQTLDIVSKGWERDMWAQLFKVASMTKGALVVGVAASAAVVSSAAEFSNTPSHNEVPSATPAAKVSEPKAPPVAQVPPPP
jgi:hypothetical protein